METETAGSSGNESVFVAVERGAPWPAALGACSEGHAGTAVIVQGEGESAMRFARRASSRMERLAGGAHALTQAVIAVGHEAQPATQVARAAIAQALLRSMSAASQSLLIFAVPRALPDEARHQLMALVELLVELGGTRLGIRVVATGRVERDALAATNPGGGARLSQAAARRLTASRQRARPSAHTARTSPPLGRSPAGCGRRRALPSARSGPCHLERRCASRPHRCR